MTKLLIANLIAICLLFLHFGYKEIQPALIYATHGDEYKELMYECDHAMREHYIAKMALELEVSDLQIKNLHSTELGLVKCHN